MPNYTARKSLVPEITFLRILACFLIFPIFYLIFKIVEAKNYKIEFYDNKIVTYSGVFNKSKRQSAFMGITSISVHQTFFGQIFDYGYVSVDCIGKWDIDTNNIKDPAGLESYLQSTIIQKKDSTVFFHA